MNKLEHIHIRVDPRIKEKIARAAAKERRSFSNLVQLILAQWVEKKK